MAISYTKKMFIERVKKHIVDGFPNTDFKVTSNEILLYIDSAIPFVMKGQMFDNAKVTGVLEVPEAYLVTYQITPITLHKPTNEWKGTLPQTPLSLPTGYAITDVYASIDGTGRGQSFFPTQTKRVPFRNNMPKPLGSFYRINGSTIFLSSYNGQPFFNVNIYVEMPISRTSSIDDAMNIPDDAIEPIFTKVIASLMQRYQIPNDQILDNQPAGNKSS